MVCVVTAQRLQNRQKVGRCSALAVEASSCRVYASTASCSCHSSRTETVPDGRARYWAKRIAFDE